mgnify:CR=1 FL=1
MKQVVNFSFLLIGFILGATIVLISLSTKPKTKVVPYETLSIYKNNILV